MISVVIPVYNAQSYLRRCMDSVLSSPCRDFEILLINDGSTDSSFDICAEYARLDRRVRLFSQENQGVSAARNRGISECRGEWIVFVDADDVISQDFLSLIAQQSPDTADLLLFDFTESEAELDSMKKAPARIRFDKAQMPELIRKNLLHVQLLKNGKTELFSSWCKAYKSALIRQHALCFSPQLSYREDQLFNLSYLLKAQSCIYIPRPVYFYRILSGSLSRRFHPELSRNYLYLMQQVKTVLQAGGVLPLLEKEYTSYLLDYMAFVLLQSVFSPCNKNSYREKQRLCREMQETAICRQALRHGLLYEPLHKQLFLFAFSMKWYRMVSIFSRIYCQLLQLESFCKRKNRSREED